MATPEIQAPTPLAAAPPAGRADTTAASGNDGFEPFGEDGFTFADLLDIVNPLQHIPIVGTLYRQLTGDTLDPGARLAGGALFGGAIGVVVAGFNAALEDATGKDAGAHVLALFDGGTEPPAATAVAAASAAESSLPLPDLAQLAPLAAPAAPTVPGAAPPPERPIDLAALAPLAPAAVVAVASATAGPAPTDAPAAGPRALPPGPVPPGALATEGGWFTETMLAALEKYQASARLAAARQDARPGVPDPS